jgi:hypothetical protein
MNIVRGEVFQDMGTMDALKTLFLERENSGIAFDDIVSFLSTAAQGQVVQIQSFDPGRVLGDEPAGSAAEVEDFFTAAKKGIGGSVEIDLMIVA